MALGEVPGHPPCEQDPATSEEIDEMEIAESRRTFEDHISKLKEQWQRFSGHRNEFKNLRFAAYAHFLDFSHPDITALKRDALGVML